ncbi:MAG: RNA-guided endonuclease InsQ/TnpB family protein [Lachnospiraceae bacterium]
MKREKNTRQYLCIKQQLKRLTKEEYLVLRQLCHAAKNLYNEGLYRVRQHFFQTEQYLPYSKNYHLLKNSENYRMLNSNMAQQILKEVDGVFQSFFGLLKLARQGGYDHREISLPHYLPKDGYMTLSVGFVRLNENRFVLPYSNSFRKTHAPIIISMPPILKDKRIKEIRIIPKANARFFEIQYTYEAEKIETILDKNKALAIDLGVNNLAACVTNEGHSFLVDGKRIKSINQWFNKENARLQSIRDLQGIKGTTKHQAFLARRRNHAVNDYINKTCRYIINYCIKNQIGHVVIGYNKELQKKSNIGRRNNQNLVQLPVGEIRKKLEYLCRLYGIHYVLQEESYTSQASFFDGDTMPVYGEEDSRNPVHFSGKRIKRGLYRTSTGYEFNADVNGALNILRKSNVVCLDALYSRGVVATPMRIRVA